MGEHRKAPTRRRGEQHRPHGQHDDYSGRGRQHDGVPDHMGNLDIIPAAVGLCDQDHRTPAQAGVGKI
jgi:hypothetical protein